MRPHLPRKGVSFVRTRLLAFVPVLAFVAALPAPSSASQLVNRDVRNIKLDVWQDWVYHGRFRHLFGRYTYMGQPVHGFGSSHFGAPTDGYGRLLYLDTHNSAYGSGWRRENSFLAHNPTGVFCYGFFKHNAGAGGYKHPPGFAGV